MPEFRIDAPEPSPEEELTICPVEAESAAEVLARLERTHRANFVDDDEEDIKPPDTGRTFTLKQMFLVMTGIGIWLGILRLLKAYSLAMAAGLTGLVALAALFYALSHDDAPGYMRLTGWILMAVYLVASAVALMN